MEETKVGTYITYPTKKEACDALNKGYRNLLADEPGQKGTSIKFGAGTLRYDASYAEII